MSVRARPADSATRADEHSSRNCNRLTQQDQQQDEETPPPPSILSQPVWSEDTMSGSTATRTATFVQALSETPLEAQLADSKFKFISRSLYQQRSWPISDIAHDTLSGVFPLSFFCTLALSSLSCRSTPRDGCSHCPCRRPAVLSLCPLCKHPFVS
ncbi:hypothetical protein BGY98DRAFT_376802 [Russula aff. rugulosa BPL654]|nr:hypothetical protein BGY98DRAFT_376802 [Russula aff. rugulosa BPL654]